MKCLIIYYSQTGNTGKIARAVQKGIKRVAEQCDIVPLKKARYDDLKNYDLIGIASPVWFADPPNLTLWVDGLPPQKGKQVFFFSTHGTMPLLYAPVMSRRLTMKDFTVIGWNDWYGGFIMEGVTAWYTDGHPDEIDLKEAEEFGVKIVEKSKKIAGGQKELIPPLPDMPVISFQALDLLLRAIHRVPGFSFHGILTYDRTKCNYPKCHICIDNCPMDYMDFSAEPRKYGEGGDKCNTGCNFCELICPSGAITVSGQPMISINQTEAKRLQDIQRIEGKNAFVAAIDEAEEQGKFRRLVPREKIGMHVQSDKEVKRPKFKISKEEE